ncbi:MAG: hypothetical protein ABW277_19930 [Longimicrobiaceae bacterium]
MDRSTRLLALAREIASANPTFHEVRGPGAGDHATREFMKELRRRALEAFGGDYSERRICGATSFAVDFYFPEERTVVEVALGLPNSASEFEKDILKAIIAQDYGNDVDRLFFISRPGAEKKCSQPGRRAVLEWARTKHRLVIEVHELEGEPRRRRGRK